MLARGMISAWHAANDVFRRFKSLEQRQHLVARMFAQKDQDRGTPSLSIQRKERIFRAGSNDEGRTFAHGNILRLERHTAVALDSMCKQGKKGA